MFPLKILLRQPDSIELEIGSGVPSGPKGEWRIFVISPEVDNMVVFYPEDIFIVDNKDQWSLLPERGLQAIVALGGVWHGADEYIFHEISRYGVYLSDREYELIQMKAEAIR